VKKTRMTMTTVDERSQPTEALTAPEEVSAAIEAFSSQGDSHLPSASGPTTVIPDRLYFRIGDVADLAGVKPYVLRYWETEFPMISPQKSASGQRVYRRGDVETVLLIKHLLYEERYSIDGARRRLRDLRKDGALKTFKQETLAARPNPAAKPAEAVEAQAARQPLGSRMNPEAVQSIIELARELKSLADTSL
jgi:DNA-binding transcriptional MerR regulator